MLPDRGKYVSRLLLYRGKYISRLVRAPLSRHRSERGRAVTVTLFVTTKDNRDGLVVTVDSALRTAAWPDLRLWVATNGSSDGTPGALRAANLNVAELRILEDARPQHEWYDWIVTAIETDVCVVIHDDMIFTRPGWLDVIVGRLMRQDVLLVGGEYAGPHEMVEPIGGETVAALECLSTWIFAFTPALGSLNPSASFAFMRGGDPARGENRVVADLGGQLISRLRSAGTFATMPPSFTSYWLHAGAISWTRDWQVPTDYRLLKEHQRRHTARLAARAMARWGVEA